MHLWPLLKAMHKMLDNKQIYEQQGNVKKIQMVLERIVSSIKFLGQIGLALRGQGDSGAGLMPQSNFSEIDSTQRNFRAVLQFMAACNYEVSNKHICTAEKITPTSCPGYKTIF